MKPVYWQISESQLERLEALGKVHGGRTIKLVRVALNLLFLLSYEQLHAILEPDFQEDYQI